MPFQCEVLEFETLIQYLLKGYVPTPDSPVGQHGSPISGVGCYIPDGFS